MNNILNLNQSPEEIANEAKQLMRKLTYSFWGEFSETKITELAINLIENKLAMVATKIDDQWNPKFHSSDFTTLSKVLEILNKEIK